MVSNVSFTANSFSLKTDSIGRLLKNGEVYLKKGDKYIVSDGNLLSPQVGVQLGGFPLTGKFISAVKADEKADTIHIVGNHIIHDELKQDKINGDIEIFTVTDYEKFIGELKERWDGIINSVNKSIQDIKSYK